MFSWCELGQDEHTADENGRGHYPVCKQDAVQLVLAPDPNGEREVSHKLQAHCPAEDGLGPNTIERGREDEAANCGAGPREDPMVRYARIAACCGRGHVPEREVQQLGRGEACQDGQAEEGAEGRVRVRGNQLVEGNQRLGSRGIGSLFDYLLAFDIFIGFRRFRMRYLRFFLSLGLRRLDLDLRPGLFFLSLICWLNYRLLPARLVLAGRVPLFVHRVKPKLRKLHHILSSCARDLTLQHRVLRELYLEELREDAFAGLFRRTQSNVQLLHTERVRVRRLDGRGRDLNYEAPACLVLHDLHRVRGVSLLAEGHVLERNELVNGQN